MSGQRYPMVAFATTIWYSQIMYQETFEGIGLSPNEAKIYEVLVKFGELGVSEIATRSQIHRRNAYDAIRRLIDKGLAFEIFSSLENLYSAVDPGKLLELTEEKRKSIEVILPDLEKKFHNRAAREEAFIYKGLEGQKNVWRDIIRVGKDNYFIGAKSTWLDPRLKAARAAFIAEVNRKKIKFFQLYDYETPGKTPGFPGHYSFDMEYRVMPKEYSTTSAIHIFGDYVVTYTGLVEVGKFPDDTVFFVLHSAKLADSYRTWFKYMWAQSKEGPKQIKLKTLV